MRDGFGRLLLRGLVVAGVVAGVMTLYRREQRPTSLPAVGSAAPGPTFVAPVVQRPNVSDPTRGGGRDSTIDLGDLSSTVGPPWGPPYSNIGRSKTGGLVGQSAGAALKPFHTRFLYSITGPGWPHWKELKYPPSFLGSMGGWEFYAAREGVMPTHGHPRQTFSIECDDSNGSQALVTVECDADDDDRESQSVHLQMKDAKGVNVQLQCDTRRE